MKNFRKIRKTIYSLVIATSIVAGSLQGMGAGQLPLKETLPGKDFYRNPYSSSVFSTEEKPAVWGAEKFSDVPGGAWYYEYLDTLVRQSVVAGKSENSFDPAGTLTVPECAALIVRCLGLDDLAKKEQEALSAQGGAKWYAGYMKVCVDAGIIDEGLYGYSYKNGIFLLDNENAVKKAVKRYELCAFLARMTTLDGKGVTAKNTYGELGGLGHEFIRGGMYDTEAMEKYRYEIKDFEDIPKDYRSYVLMGYYNGLFNGDAVGNFNPDNNLTRAEMTKLVAVLLDAGKRFGNDYRENIYLPEAGDYRKDVNGERVLTKSAGNKILALLADMLSYSNGYLNVTLESVAPLGYIAEAHIYTGVGAYDKALVLGGKSENMHTGSATTSVWMTHGKVVYVLRNISRGGEIEGVLEATLADGKITTSDGIRYPPIA